MKKTTLLFFLSLFFISSFSGFSQITLYSEDFDASSINGTDLTAADYNTVSWPVDVYTENTELKKFSHDGHDEALDETYNHWHSQTSYNTYYGSAVGMVSYRATISGDGWGQENQEQSLITPTWTALTSTMDVSFKWSHYGGSNDEFVARLQQRTGSNNFANFGSALVDESSSGYNGAVESETGIAVTPGYEYRLVFYFRATSDYGAAVDDILVTHPALDDHTYSSSDTISTDVEWNDVTIADGVTITIDEDGSLIVQGDLVHAGSGKIVLQSIATKSAAIKVVGSSTGDITYERWVNEVNATANTGWDLIGSPVTGQSISGFSSQTALATSSGQTAIGLFDNSDASWTNYTGSGSGWQALNFIAGKGYAMATDAGGATVDFTGDISTSTVTIDIEDHIATGSNWDLIANPFPSYLNANDDAHKTNNFLTENTDKLDDTYEAVYGYDADGSGYTPYNHTGSTAVYIAPGQGFMVASDDTDAFPVSFTEAMQTINGTNDFVLEDTMDDVFEVLLRLYHGDQEIEETRLYFENGLSLGLNPGYDAGAFDQNAALMTRLVEEDEGHGMAINAMSTESMDDVVIPLEINQTAGQEFRVNLHTSTIGEVNVYLEDTELQTLTLLNEEDFVMTPTSDLSDVGRFFIHTTESTLSNEEVNTSLLNAYKEVNANYITIEGLATQATSTEVSLYNILGTKVLDTTLDNTTNTQTISTNGFATGIYVLKLISGKNQLTKKLIIK